MKRLLAAAAAFIGPTTKANAISRGALLILLLAGAASAIVIGTTTISGTCANGNFLYNNSGVVGCSAGSGSSVAFPQAITGGVSGGIPYFSTTAAMSASALLNANALMVGGGAGAAPLTVTTGAGVLTALGIAPNTAGGTVTASAGSIASGALLTGGGSGSAISGITPGSGVASALAAATASAANVQTGTSTTNLVTPSALSGSSAFQTLTDGATIAWNVASGYNAKLTLTASGHTLSNPTNVIVGQTYIVVISAATYTMSFDTAYDWGGAGAPTLTASKDNIVTCLAMATSGANSLYCSAALGF